MKTIRFAVLGCGPRWQGVENVYAKFPEVEIVAFCDIADGFAEDAAKRYADLTGKQAKVFRCYEDMVKGCAYDASLIYCDPDIQVDYAEAELLRGIHVMTEVPAAYTIDQCWRLVKAVEKSGSVYQLAEQTRYWKFIRDWRAMAERGEFGKIYYAEGEYLHFEPCWDYFRNKKTGARITTNDPSYHTNPDYEVTWRYRTFGDPILYLPHELSPLLSITGGRIDTVSCLGSKKGDSYTKGFDVRDLECALMHNTNGAIFSIRAGFCAPYGRKADTYAHWYQIKGTERSVEWARSELDTPKMYTLDKGWETRSDWHCADDEAPEIMKHSLHGGADGYPVFYFIDAIQKGTTPPMDVYKAVETAAPAILAAESANRGGITLTVPDFRKAKEA